MLDTVLDEVVETLVSFRRVAAAEELAEHLPARHGCSGRANGCPRSEFDDVLHQTDADLVIGVRTSNVTTATTCGSLARVFIALTNRTRTH
ncbi:hypothetical protein ACFYOT_26650 [Saccharothrix saharensis]|uniref:hypothetical protein n=1 Tax=Saccharothrix saharensis TaxID=571190 RepID=UPI003697A22D